MDSFNLKKLLKKIFKRVKIELSRDTIDDESLVSMEYYKHKNWKLVLYDRNFSYMQVDFFTQALQELHIDKVDTFLYNWEDIQYYKSVKSEYQLIKDIFYNIGATDEDWSSPDVVATSIIITNKTLDFIVFVDEYRETYYFYGNKEFIDIVMPISFEAFSDFYKANYDFFEDEPLHVDYLKWLWKHYIEPKN